MPDPLHEASEGGQRLPVSQPPVAGTNGPGVGKALLAAVSLLLAALTTAGVVLFMAGYWDLPLVRGCSAEAAVGEVIDGIAEVTADRSRGTAFHIGDGKWLTAAHVVTEAAGADWTVGLRNAGVDTVAQVVDMDGDADLALLAAESKPSALGWDSLPPVGTETLIAGYGRGQVSLTAGVTRGIISERYSRSGLDYIRTDAAVDPGDSGGPLLSLCGGVIGVVQSKPSGESAEGVAYALAASAARTFVQRTLGNLEGPQPLPIQDDRTLTRRGLRATGFWRLDDTAWGALQRAYASASEEDPFTASIAQFGDFYDWRRHWERQYTGAYQRAGMQPGRAAELAREQVDALPTTRTFYSARTALRRNWIVDNPCLADRALLYGHLSGTDAESARFLDAYHASGSCD